MKRQELIDRANDFADWCDLVFKFGMLLLVLSIIIGLFLAVGETITPGSFGLVCLACLAAIPGLIAIGFVSIALLLLGAIEQHCYKTLRFVQSANPGVDLQIEPDLSPPNPMASADRPPHIELASPEQPPKPSVQPADQVEEWAATHPEEADLR